jgi:glycerate kinase
VLGLADVTNPLCGPRGASAVYGPQKGIPENDILEWDTAVRHFAAVACRDVHAVDIDAAGMGAAGGLGFALACFAGADLQSGADFVRRHSGADAAMPQADLVITGEGRIDAQSAQGKVLGGIVGAAGGFSLPVVAFCGTAEGDVETLATRLGVEAVLPIMETDMPLSESMRDAERLLRMAIDRAWPRISAMR